MLPTYEENEEIKKSIRIMYKTDDIDFYTNYSGILIYNDSYYRVRMNISYKYINFPTFEIKKYIFNHKKLQKSLIIGSYRNAKVNMSTLLSLNKIYDDFNLY